AQRRGDRRRRVSGIEDVVRRLFAFAESGDAAVLADGVEGLAAAGDQLVRIALVAGIEDELVARRVEDVVQGEGQLDNAEIPAEVTADGGDDVDDPLADLFGELR